MKLFTLALSFLMITFISQSFAQMHPAEAAAKNITKKYENVEQVVEQQLKDLYGEYYSAYGENRLDYYKSIYDRIEFLTGDYIPAEVPNISTVTVKEKYNPSVIQHDNLTSFNQDHFNVFKYHIPYESKTDVYYRLYNTNVVMKIKKK